MTRHARSIGPYTALVLSLGLVFSLIAVSPAAAGDGWIDEDGNVNLNLHFLFPPLPDDLARAQEQVQRASRLMCDATEGQMRIASTRFSAGGADEPAGDIWYYPPGAITRSRSAGLPVHNEANRIYLRYDSIRSDVLFHELGHLVFGLGDQYDEQRREGGACGIGPAFDAGGLLDEQNHTVMQQASYQRCVTATGERTNRACYGEGDPACLAGETCPLPDLMSEFSVPANQDPLRGDNVLPADTCPSPRAGDTYRVAGFLGADSDMIAFDATDFETAKDTSVRETAREYLDEQGVVTGYDKDSAHPIWVFSERVGAQSWTLHFGMDRKHIDPEDEGELEMLGSVDILFEATPSLVVSEPGEPDRDHRAVIAAGGQFLADPAYSPPTITIPDLAGPAGSRVLEIDLAGLSERDPWTGGSLDDSSITWGEFQQLGTCGDTTACEARWNDSTQRWEASSVTSAALQAGETPLSDWERLVANMSDAYDLSWSMPAGLPTVDPAASHDCDAPVTFDVAIDGLDQVYLVLDRSYSMHETRDWLGIERSRLDWAKAGARGFANLMVDAGVDVGLISFNDSIVHELPLANVVPDGTGSPGDHEIGDVLAAIDALYPDLNTAIGDALDLARSELAGAAEAGRSQAVLLLSDGQENGGILDPETVADELREDGVRVYTVPLGSDADGELLARVADTTQGDTFDADSPDELPPLYARTWGRLRGEEPIWRKVPSETEVVVGAFERAVHLIPVEVGSERLNVMMSGRGEDPWNPTCQLRSPSGVVTLACSGPEVQSDEYFRLFRVPAPEPGIWTLEIVAYQQPTQRSYIWAHSEGAGPDCWAGAERHVLASEPEDGLMIRAAASWTAPLGQDVLYLIQVETPNGTLLAAEPMSLNAEGNGAEYLFDDFAGRGEYEVTVTCLATEDSSFAPGERVDLVEILAEGKPEAFLRQTGTSFFLDSDDWPPPRGDDCDGDGFPDTTFPGAFDDDDGDGVQNYCDTDDDGDDVPDSEDRCPDEPETFGEFSRRDPIDGCPVPEPGLALGLAIGAISLALRGGRCRAARG